MFSQNLKYQMEENGLTQQQLAKKTGLYCSSISQYLSGKNVPAKKTREVLAQALNCSAEELVTPADVPGEYKQPVILERITVTKAARLMNKAPMFVCVGLRKGILPFGTAIRMDSGKWSYYISPKRFYDYICGTGDTK